MRLVNAADVADWNVVRRFGYRPWTALLVLAVGLCLPFVPLTILRQSATAITGLPGWAWAVGSPIILFAGLVWMLVLAIMWRVFVAGMRPGNWVMKIAPDGLFLKFRSYLNHHFPDDRPTVVFLPFQEIASVRQVCQFVRAPESAGDVATRGRSYLELRLKSRDTDDLRRAIAAEAQVRPQRGRQRLSRFHHCPVWIPEPGVIRVEWRGAEMLRCLSHYVPIDAPARSEDAAYSGDGSGREDERIIELIEQGRRLDAIRLIRRHHNLSLAEARRFLDDVTSRMVGMGPR